MEIRRKNNMIDLRLGDCIEILKTLPDNSVDSIVTDPPYHLTSITKRFGKEGSAPAQYGIDGAFARASKGFMGKEWDGGDIAFRTDVWAECLRVLKPGGHLLSFGGSRTYHRMAVAIEDAGFEVRDQIMWIYGSGFPKSHNIGKAIDKIQGNEREVVGDNPNHRTLKHTNSMVGEPHTGDGLLTKGQSEWEGWGTALKPAHEPICMARKPLSEKSIAENVLKHGTGGINIDGSRIGFKDGDSVVINKLEYQGKDWYKEGCEYKGGKEHNEEGRFPANIIFDEEAGKLLDEQSGVSKGTKRGEKYNKEYDNTGNATPFTPKQTAYSDNNTYDDKGGASRFFYCPKVSKKERDMGLDDFEAKAQRSTSGGTRDFNARCANCGKKFIGSPNTICSCDNPITDNQVFKKKNNHPTVKPIKLMEYLITLVTPKGGVVLEPFMGSGSTGIAAKNLGMSFIGIEKEQEYFDIAKQRIGE
jgi:site-specific DNA-methyltransferase (adenine-specific)